MERNLERQVKAYLKQISKNIPRNYPQKQDIMAGLTQRVYEYIEEHPQTTYRELTREIGLPSEIASSFLEGLDEGEVTKLFRQDKNKLFFSIGVCILSVALLISSVLKYYHWHTTESVYAVEETIIFDGTEIPSDSEISEMLEDAEENR